MASKTATGEPTAYSEQDEADFYDASDEAWDDEADYAADDDRRAALSGGGEAVTPTRMTITAEVEWSGSRNIAHNGMRTVRLDDLDLSRAAAALSEARAASTRAASAREATSYRAQSWHAQLRELTGSARGSELADRAGLNPTARTLSAWLSESRAPSRANRDAIARAYEGLRTYSRDTAQDAARQARHAYTEAVTEAVRERYGSEVRFFDVRSVEFDD